jgi:hypothetical protein
MYSKYIPNILLTHLGQDHPQGQGSLQNYSCGVKFHRLIPIDLVVYPYIIWVSFGEHTHPPPAILKTPRDIYSNLFQLIEKINNPCLTRSKSFNILLIY